MPEAANVDEQARPLILIIEDSRSVREEIRTILGAAQPRAQFIEAENGLEGVRMMAERAVDLVVCDMVMPVMDGAKFLHMRASRPDFRAIPVIVLTSLEDMDLKVRALMAGANDYVMKPFHSGELVARVLVHLKNKLLQDELRKKNELLELIASTDSLTQVFNRRHFLELAHKEFERSNRLHLKVSLMVMDVDHFKQINDTFGHQVGDRVLITFCEHVRKALRTFDVFGRYGGDEFTVLLPNTDGEQALAIGQRIEREMRAFALDALRGGTLSISGGIATRRGPVDSLDVVLKAADAALFEAKRSGRGRIVAAGPGKSANT